jgi:hypothetical protein
MNENSNDVLAKERVPPKIPYNYNVNKISDLSYLEDIFAPEYDNFKSLDYLTKTRAILLEQGYPQTPTLNEYLFWSTMSRRMQIIYQLYHKKQLDDMNKDSPLINTENTKFLSEIKEIAEYIAVLQKTLDVTLQTTKQVKDVVDLHKETCEKAEKFLKSHFGEYVKANQVAGKITDIIDKAYWAFMQDMIYKDDGKEEVSYVWSEELKHLINKKLIPIEHMAFILRTSIEGLLYTASIRSDKFEEFDKEKAEHNLKEMMLEFESSRHSKDMDLLNEKIG